jgi:hypothetical protein
MPRTHPHAAAAYRIVPLPDGSFGVEVTIPDSRPTTVSRFSSEEEAEAWIANHRRLVESQTERGGWFRISATDRRHRSRTA